MTPFSRFLTILILLSISIAGSLTAPPLASAQATYPSLSIYVLNPTSFEVHVTATEPGNATFTTRASVTNPKNQTVTVTLSASTSTGWVTTISPKKFTLGTSGLENITVVVNVPEGTPVWMIGKLTVNGTCFYSGGTSTALSYATVMVLQYHEVETTIAPHFVGSRTNTFYVKLKNMGNGLDTLQVFVVNESQLESKHLSVTFLKKSYDNVPACQYEMDKMTVNYTGKEFPLDFNIELRTESVDPTSPEIPLFGRTSLVHVSFVRPETSSDTGVPVWTIAGGIAAISIILIIVFVVIIKRFRKKPIAI